MEMHILAFFYHWDRDTIIKLSSKERKMWVRLIHEWKVAENKEIEKSMKKR